MMTETPDMSREQVQRLRRAKRSRSNRETTQKMVNAAKLAQLKMKSIFASVDKTDVRSQSEAIQGVREVLSEMERMIEEPDGP